MASASSRAERARLVRGSSLEGTFLGGLAPDVQARILADAEACAVPAGAAVFGGGDARVGIVLDGVARTYLTAADGRQLTIRYARRGAIVGQRSDLSGDHSPLGVQAITACTILEFSPATLSELTHSDAAVGAAMVVELGRRLEDVYSIVAAHAFGTMRERVGHHIMELARSDDGRRHTVAHVTQQGLADAVGTARQVVARVLADFRDEGLIRSHNGRIEVLDAARMAAIGGHWRPATSVYDADTSLGAEAFLDASPNAIVAVDTAGIILYANPSAEHTFGWSRHELYGQSVQVLVPPRLAQQHEVHLAAYATHPVARPMGIRLQLSGVRKDRTEFAVEISLAPVESPRGRLIFATAVDVSGWQRPEP